MSKLDIINTEIERRENSNLDLVKGQADTAAAIEQFNQLDEMYRSDEKTSREYLECLYLENRHYTGKWPVVYTSTDTEFYPFYNGETDVQCNPYFPITKVKDGTFDGIAPYPALTTRTGDHARDRNYTPIESSLRAIAIAVIAAFPDISDEVGKCTPTADPDTSAQCSIEGGVWGYVAGDTATEKMRAAMDPWRASIVTIMSELCNDVGGVELAFWQDILDNIDDVLAAVQVDVTNPTNTVDFTTSSTEDIARDYLVAQNGTFTTHINNRSSFLTNESTVEEEVFLGIVKLRLHQANGSFAKLKAAKGQQTVTKSIISDNNSAIKSLNILKVKNS